LQYLEDCFSGRWESIVNYYQKAQRRTSANFRMGKKALDRSWRRRTTHGPRRTVHGAERQFM